jgi:glucosamine-6-phosphate deaminase
MCTVLQSTTNNASIKVFEDKNAASASIANHIGNLITSRQKEGKQAVLGLATGTTPMGIYKELVRMHREEQLSFHNVITFNLDEYYPMASSSMQSYVRYMHQHLFNHVDIPPQNIHIPDGTVQREHVESYCIAYDKKIAAVGGIDLQLLGIGRTGHIGFNEPPALPGTGTSLVSLHQITIEDAASDFGGIAHTPQHAITMGVGTILQAKEIIVAGWGKKKANIIRESIEGKITAQVPASYLQQAQCVTWHLDQEAAAELSV